MSEALDYIKHLHSNEIDGYIQLMQLDKDKRATIKNINYEGLTELVQEYIGQVDTYTTPNTFYKPQRASENIRQLRALYIDLDIDKTPYSQTETIYEVYSLVFQGVIPTPTLVTLSGRGVHLYWRLKHAPKQAIYYWYQLNDYLFTQLKDLGADLRATDVARLLRIPETINSKNGKTCKIVKIEDTVYSMYDLMEQYIAPKRKTQQAPNKKASNGKVKYLMNSYSLHSARAYDLEILCRLRNYDVEGYRNSILHLYAYWQGLIKRESESLEYVVHALNDKLKNPLKDTEIKAIIKSVGKAVEDFITYEYQVNKKEIPRAVKGERDKKGYWYTNKKLIELLNITELEQEKLKTIISSKEKARRRSVKYKESIRNENGLTQREQNKLNNINRVRDLSEQGYNQLEIAEIVGMTQGYISQLLKKI